MKNKSIEELIGKFIFRIYYKTKYNKFNTEHQAKMSVIVCDVSYLLENLEMLEERSS